MQQIQESDKRTRLLEAAIRVFSEKGYEGANVSDISQKAGVGYGTFYLYFPTKKEAFKAAVHHLLGLMLAPSDPSLQDELRTPEDYTVYIRGVYQTVFAVYREHAGLLRPFLVEGLRDGEIRPLVLDFYRKVTAWVEDSLRPGVEVGILKPMDPEILTQALIGIIQQVAHYWFDIRDERDVDPVIDTLTRFETTGIFT